MKRKRGTDDELQQQVQPVKRQSEHLSHINIPIKMNIAPVPPELAPSDSGHKGNIQSRISYRDQTDRMDWQHAHAANQSIPSQGAIAAQDVRPSQPSEAHNPPRKAIRPSADALRKTVEVQFSLEILLKHRELRLIDQEIAKCQVALEQLRRCQIIPYPAMTSDSEDMLAVASSTGRTLENYAPDAPPWGVTTGPYTRHYRQWLLADRTFGDHVAEEASPLQHRSLSERSVRASTAGKSSQAAQSRAQRGAASARLKALPHGYPEAKEDKGPMIVKRSTDGQAVKLVCLDCRRSDFNSAQGFINHCRIAHSRNFQSHDAAAVACGEEVELDQAGGVAGEANTAVTSGAGLVHPLVRSAHVARSAAPTPPMELPKWEPSNAGSAEVKTPGPMTRSGESTSHHSSPPFRPSPQTPHLSALFARIGRGTDLEEEVNLAKTKVDIDAVIPSDDEVEEDVEANVPQTCNRPASHSTRGVVRPDLHPNSAVMSPAQLDLAPSVKPPKFGSRKPKDLNIHASHPRSSSSFSILHGRTDDNQQSRNHHLPIHDGATSPNLSPDTVEPHQAPSLVSDDDEFENTHSECSSSADLAEDLEQHYFGLDFQNGHDDAMEDLEGSSTGTKHLALGAGPKGAPASQKTSSMRAPDAVRDDNRHVSFASPLRRPRKKGTK
ncbi:MAG: hypothetical protein Q9208_002983 [Pyrenodesmia sp. 3 TL-2023]